MSARPTIWPHLLIEDGPALAGLAHGDAIAFLPTQLVACGAREWRDLEVAKATLASTRAASVAEVSAFVSALDPERAARDAAIVEECGILAG